MNPNAIMEDTVNVADIFGADQMKVDQYKEYQGGHTVMPEGIYAFTVERCSLKKTKEFANNGGGQYVATMFRHTDSNAVLWNNYNIVNQKPDVEDRAKAEMVSIVRAAGIADIPETFDGFIDLQVGIQVGRKQTRDSLKAMKINPMGEPEYENFIIKYVPLSEVPDASSKESSAAPAKTPAKAPPTGDNSGVNLPQFAG